MNNPHVEAPKQCSPCGGARSPCGGGDGETHYLTLVKGVEGYTGGCQQRCIWCNAKTAWVCATCTTGPMSLVPLCPEFTKARKGEHKGCHVSHMCLARHRSNPTFFPKGKRGGRPKRARGPDFGRLRRLRWRLMLRMSCKGQAAGVCGV